MSRLHVCHNCPKRKRPCNGPCPCTADPAARDIVAIAKAGDCPLGLFGNPAAEDHAAAGRDLAAAITHGAAGLVKAALRIDRADDETIARRRGICGGCEHNVGRLLQRCDVCGCGLLPKTTLKGEACPVGRW